jgi:predicted O-methyltransferase YrrM
MAQITSELWSAVDEYLEQSVVHEDEALRAARRTIADAGLPQISVAPNQGKLLYILARLQHAQRILEIGTLGAYSTIWLARAAAPTGRVITLEADPTHAEVARANLARAGIGALVEVRLGKALELLPGVASLAPFDLVFIDADKPNIPDYFQWALKLTRPSGLIIVDNVVRDGALADATSTDPNVIGVRRLHELLRSEPRVSATTIQTVGSKGYDGLTLAIVNERQ